MTDHPGSGGPEEPGGSHEDAWDAWRHWSDPPAAAGGGAAADDWDAWKTWPWTAGAGPRPGHPVGCSTNLVRLGVGTVVVLLLISFLMSAFAEPEDLAADDLIAAIDALPETGPRDQRPPDTAAGETATFPAPGLDPASVAAAVQAVRPPDRREQSGASVYLLYEEATVVAQPGGGLDGSEVVVFEDNRDATRRYPLLVGFPGWTTSLDDFDARARSRGGIGGFRGGGGGFGK